MPFDSSFDDTYKLGIKDAIREYDPEIIVERLDEQMFTEGMLTRIYSQIERADLIVADMTNKNPNVFYEVGYAHAKEKRVILITKDAGDIPFDLKHYRHIVYNGGITSLKKQLTDNIVWAFEEIEKTNNFPLEIEMRLTGFLGKTSYEDTANINLKFDFYNKSEKPVKIDALYLYTSDGWNYIQNGVECSQGRSDLPTKSIRHQIIPQITRITKGNWTQISIDGTKVLGSTYKNKELYEEYTFQGPITLRIVTDRGAFDFEKFAKLTIKSIPF
jgi:nucleoside 2-deoxyribosyltransferase